MADMHEVIIDWSSINADSGLSIIYFAGVEDPDLVLTAVDGALTAMAPVFSTGLSMFLRNEGRIIESTTGELTGFWTGTDTGPVAGGSANPPVANASQVLLRMQTSNIVAGRNVKGRMFIPGCATTSCTNGELAGASAATVAAAWAPLTVTSPNFTWVVFSRPFPGDVATGKPARSGAANTIQGVGVWNELAVLRQRR